MNTMLHKDLATNYEMEARDVGPVILPITHKPISKYMATKLAVEHLSVKPNKPTEEEFHTKAFIVIVTPPFSLSSSIANLRSIFE